MPRPIIIDTDPGTDDLFALYVADYLSQAAPDRYALIAVIATFGNASLHHTYANARYFSHKFLKSGVPVYWGRGTPVQNSKFVSSDYFGMDGLSDVFSEDPLFATLRTDPEYRTDSDGVRMLIDASHRFAGELEVIVLGPCSTLAAALVQDPALAGRIAKVTLMGGTMRAEGNVGPVQEFNFNSDPEAVDIVLSRAADFGNNLLTVVPWEVCLDQSVSFEWYHDVLMRNAASIPVVRFLDVVNGPTVVKMRLEEGVEYVICDPVAVLVHFDESILERHRMCSMRMELMGERTRGMNISDFSVTASKDVRLVTRVDMERVKQLMSEMFAPPS